MGDAVPESHLTSGETLISLPFTGLWLTQNSPARRVPSHGTDLLGERFAIDFVGVDHRHRTASSVDWRTFLATEPVQRFLSYGRPLLAPVDGIVVAVHDGEVDHVGRRSQLSLVPYALGQTARLRQGVSAVAGNSVIIALPSGPFVALAHLKAGSFLVSAGDKVAVGQPIAECGNSGNSTQPHVHLQVMDSPDLSVARGLPMSFRYFREWPRGEAHPRVVETGMPGEGAVIEPMAAHGTDAVGLG